jgi:hypothetical protein
MITAALIVLTVCFVGLLALVCAAPEGWEDSDGFHLGKPTLDQLLADLPQPCRSCGLGPCVCGEFDIPPSPYGGHLERASAEPGVRSLCEVSPFHSTGVNDGRP